MASPNGLFARSAPSPTDSISTTNQIITELPVTGSDLTPLPMAQRDRSSGGFSSQAMTQARDAGSPELHVARRRVLAIVFAIVIGVVGARFWRSEGAAERSDGARVTYTPESKEIHGADVDEQSTPAGPSSTRPADPSPAPPADPSPAPPADPSPAPPADPSPAAPSPKPPAGASPGPPGSAVSEAPRRQPPRPAPQAISVHSAREIKALYESGDYRAALHACAATTMIPAIERICFLAACRLGEVVPARHWLIEQGCALRKSLVDKCKEIGSIDISSTPGCY
jgi:hypothetical protein